MASAEITETFNCTPKQFFDLVVDYEAYPEFLPEMKEVSVLKRTKTSTEMEYVISVVKTFKYKLKTKEKAPDKGAGSVIFEYTEGDLFKTMKGSWTIEEAAKKKTFVTYKIEASFGMLVPGIISNKLVSVNLPSMMKNFQKRVKKVYG